MFEMCYGYPSLISEDRSWLTGQHVGVQIKMLEKGELLLIENYTHHGKS